MKKRKARFNDGGLNPYQGDDVDPFSAVRDEEGGTASRKEGPISEAFYEEGTGKELSTRRNLETGDYYSTEPVTRKAAPARAMPKSTPVRNIAGSGRGSMAGRTAADETTYVTGGGRSRMSGPGIGEREAYEASRSRSMQIPTASQAGPEKVSSPAMEMSDKERIRNTTLGALGTIGGAAGLAKLMHARKAKQAAELAQEAAKRFSRPQAQQVGAKVPTKAQDMAKKRAEAEAMEKAKPILQARPSTKAQRADRTRRTEEDAQIEFSKGGSASRRADGCAKRGKTKGKLY